MKLHNRLSESKLKLRSDWIEFIVLVLAFIGLGQVLAGGATLLQRLF